MRSIYGGVLRWEVPIQRAVDAAVAGLRDTSEDPTTASRDDEADKLARWHLAERGKRGAGAAEIAGALGIAVTTFTELIEPYLRQLAFVDDGYASCRPVSLVP